MRCQAYKRPPCKSLPAVREDTDRRASGARCKLHINTSGTTRVIHGRLRVQSTCERSQPRPQPRSRGSIVVYGSRSVHCARKRCHTPASIAVTIVGRRRRLEHLPQVMEQRAPGRALLSTPLSKCNHSKPWRHVYGPMNPARCSILTRRRLKRHAVYRCVSGASSTAAQCAPWRSVEPTAAMETSPRRSEPPK